MSKRKIFYVIRGTAILALCSSEDGAKKLQRALLPGTEIVTTPPSKSSYTT